MNIPTELLSEISATHDLRWDPPAALTRVRRWTCERCGDAVLVNGDVVSGSATRETCRS